MDFFVKHFSFSETLVIEKKSSTVSAKLYRCLNNLVRQLPHLSHCSYVLLPYI